MYISRRRPLFAPRYRTKRTAGQRIRRVFLVLAGLVLLLSILFELALGSVSGELADQATRRYVDASVNAVVSEFSEQVDFLNIRRDESDRIISVQTDTQKQNRFRGKVTDALYQKLNGTAKTSVPFGSTTNLAVLNGRGFPVPLRFNLEGSAEVSFRTELISAGINQSCYRVTMHVEYAVYSQSRKFAVRMTDGADFVVSETVIVGNVPQFVANAG